ncbi:hypothetical protein BOTBODRAFT_25725 [Botryobasidium botryosum FD-172 SS1]|uniref:Uncharacterized protein n=1 Tax=Botryobasidium botryosum (strain FD-172 SS1) TaxID=930990 RepID=A0A067N020_BOTB1|nr:hypothetical protein BOTBODRAFT_25725 [Botryobasidium botryosum FD-172 SS1]
MGDIPLLSHEQALAQIPAQYREAKDAGSLFFYDSTVVVYIEEGISFQIRLCPALLKKPVMPLPHFDPTVKVVPQADPFAPPYVAALHVGDLKSADSESDSLAKAEYVVLLNKYSVVPHHFLVVTKEFKSQTTPLSPPDLVNMYLFLRAAMKAGQTLLGYYNCGDRSGASQAHKHVQFLPVGEDGPPIERIARAQQVEAPDRPFSIGALPFAHHIFRFPRSIYGQNPEQLEETLGQAFLALIDLTITTIRHQPSHPSGPPNYNMLMTLEHLYIVPRMKEAHVLVETGDAMSVNACGFAGMLLVKSEKELEAVKSEGVLNILKEVGMPQIDVRVCEPQQLEIDDA